MPWARLDDRFPSNRKIRKLSDRAFRLYVSAICWSAESLTDGFIPKSDLRLVADIRGAKAAATELVNAGLWTQCEPVGDAVVPPSCLLRADFASSSCRVRAAVDAPSCSATETGWHIHDYHEYNPTAEQVRADRTAKTARQQRWRDKRKSDNPPPEPPDVDASTDASQDASRNASGDAAPRARVPVPSRPDPFFTGGPDRESSYVSDARAREPLSHIPQDWQPTPASRAAAAADTKRLGPAATKTATAKFVRHHQARNTQAADFGPLWITWLARERPDTQGAFLVSLPGGATPTPPSLKDRMAELDAIAAADQTGETG